MASPAARPALPALAPRPVYETSKRAFDALAAGAALLLLSPLLLLIAAAIRLDSRGPALFVQQRAGRHGERFRLLKFRTMAAGASARGPEGKVLEDAPLRRDDPAITRVGRLLRAASLDELPQLVNVLRGEMSLVGPRPTIPEQAAAYTPRERLRLSVLPGLTGLAQVSGRVALSWPERIEIDLDYIARRSFLLDLAIILRTPAALLRASGLYGGR